MKKLAEMYSSKLWYDKRWVKSGIASLYLQVTINRKHKEFPLKLKWPVDKIDLEQGCLLPRGRKDPDVSDYNLLIMIEHGNHTEIFRTYRIKKAPIDIDIFAREVKSFDRKSNFASWMLDELTKRYKRKEIAKRTYLNHKSAVAAMTAYKKSWPFEMLDIKWMKSFKAHLQAEDYEPGGIWSIIKSIKVYLQFAYLEPMIYVDKAVADFKNPQPQWNTPYLTTDELRRLMILYGSGNITDSQLIILKAFLFQCFTSLRISDIYRANSEWQISEDFLTFIPKKNEKNRKWVNVPIMPMAKKLIMNSLDKFFTLPNQAEYNIKLKDLAKKADIKKRLTSHVGRHTFGYLYMTTVGNIKGLQEIMGHSKIETTMRYAHIDDDFKLTSVKMIQETFSDLVMWRAK